jgi:hypothetical protein
VRAAPEEIRKCVACDGANAPEILVLDDGGGVIVQTAADFLRMRPAAQHVRRALADELTARIGRLHERNHLRLRGRSERQARDEGTREETNDHCEPYRQLSCSTKVPALVGGDNQ